MNIGHTEILSTRKQDDEKSITSWSHDNYCILHALWMSWLRSIWKRCTRQLFDRLRVLRTLLAHRLCQYMHCHPPYWCISGIFSKQLTLLNKMVFTQNPTMFYSRIKIYNNITQKELLIEFHPCIVFTNIHMFHFSINLC